MLRPYFVKGFRPPSSWRLMASHKAPHKLTDPIRDNHIVPDSDEEGDSLLLYATSHTAPLERARYHKLAEDVIEISDSDSKHLSNCCSTIDLSDDSPTASPPLNQVAKLKAIVGSPKPESPSKTQILQKLFEDSSDTDAPVLDISRFRWTTSQNQSHKRKPPFSSEVRPIATSLPSTSSSNKRVRSIHTGNYSFTDAELVPLLRCVCCDLAWTTRKTVPAKLTHIRSCQKKLGLDDDTIKWRIQRELDRVAASEEQPGKNKGKRKATPAPEAGPTSLLEEIAQNVRPKQRRKMKDVVSTVIGIEHQHEFFSERAKSKFLLDSDQKENSNSQSSQDHLTSPPLTQSFPTSKLGANEPFHTRYSYEPSNIEPEGHLETKRARCVLLEDDESAWEDEHNFNAPPKSPRTKRLSASRKGIPSPTRISASSTTKSRVKSSVPTSPSKKRAIADMDAYDDASFYASMEAIIRDDHKLWNRVLLYEPMEFEVFLTLAAGDGPVTPKLIKRVRDFLDLKAIHFNSGSSTKGKRRR
ncbi:hypothetical protein FRB91_009693 [Serendipita sp. 411]|nr:hypothetical protein FRC18_009757 [Serendipita sp. 400]KAG8858470.1 hypothetical protein FRB91_009693 [Serendipita sp. 411]